MEKKTIGAFFDLYQYEIAERSKPKDETMPTYLEFYEQGNTTTWMNERRTLLKWAMDDDPEASAIGCSENWLTPILYPNNYTNFYRSETSRRVEAMFFKPKDLNKYSLTCPARSDCATDLCPLHSEIGRLQWDRIYLEIVPEEEEEVRDHMMHFYLSLEYGFRPLPDREFSLSGYGFDISGKTDSEGIFKTGDEVHLVPAFYDLKVGNASLKIPSVPIDNDLPPIEVCIPVDFLPDLLETDGIVHDDDDYEEES